MGLYKKNYEVKELGITLPEAFAVVRKIERRGNKGAAEVWVHSTRELALSQRKPLECKIIQFKWQNGDNPYENVYTAAVTPEKVPETYEETIVETVEVDGESKEVERKETRVRMVDGAAPFDGWTRDGIQ